MHVHDKLCDHVHAKERARMSEAVSQLVLGICDAAGTGTAETVPVVVGCLTGLAEKGIGPEDEESYYNDEDDDGEVDPTVAARGLGQVGNMPTAESLWSRCVPGYLRDRYRRWRQETHGVGASDGLGVREILDTLVRDGAPRKQESVREASGKAHVRPKNSEKCAFILNCVKQNACDDRKPSGFQLPQIERLQDSVLLGGGGGGQRLCMAKLDLSNCFWSLRLPRSWVGVCVWAMPNIFGSPYHLAGNTPPSCVKSWCTAWSGRPCGGCLYCFLSTWTTF